VLFRSIIQTMNENCKKRELRHDRHTVSLLTDHMVFAPKYRGKILTGDVALITEGILCKTCKELDIEIIEIAVNPDHVHIFFKYPPKYSLSFIAKRLKGRTSRILRKEFPHLKEFCDEHLWAPSCYHGSVGNGWDVVEKYISGQDTHHAKNASYRPRS
jgi:putative transposase